MPRLDRFLPFLRWWPACVGSLRADLIAGVTVALVLIPQSMAYAQLAGLPPYHGLYAAFLPVMVAGLWGSSSHLATGPVAVVSLLTASVLAPFAAIGSDQFVSLAILLALLMGVLQLSFGVLKLGVVVNFLSHPVIAGFTNAAAIIIGLSQLHKLFGIPMDRGGHFIRDIWGVLQQLDNTHLPTLFMAVSAFLIMWVFKRFLPKAPGVLAAVAFTTAASWWTGFETHGGRVVSHIPSGLPALSIPDTDWSMLAELVTGACVISLVGFMEAISIAKAIAAKTRERVDPNQELIGQGLANIVGSFSQAYPVSGSFSRSAVNYNAGAVTGLSSIFAGIVVLITLLFLTPLLYHLPQAVLAAVIMMAVFGLINVKAFRQVWQAHRHDGITAVVTFLATLGFAPHLDRGIMAGVGLGIGLYLYRTMTPRTAFLGRYKDGTLRDIKVHPGLPTDSRIVAVRFDGSLYFANVSNFEDAIMDGVAENPEVEYVLVVAHGVNELDASGEEAVRRLVESLRANGITLVFSGLKRQVVHVMRKTGLLDAIGTNNVFPSTDKAVEAIYTRLGPEYVGEYCPLMPERGTKSMER